jgi:hypothetical protein
MADLLVKGQKAIAFVAKVPTPKVLSVGLPALSRRESGEEMGSGTGGGGKGKVLGILEMEAWRGEKERAEVEESQRGRDGSDGGRGHEVGELSFVDEEGEEDEDG